MKLANSMTRGFRCALLALLLASGGDGLAQNVTLKIRVLNPSTEPRTKTIESSLPPRVRREHVVDLDGLNMVPDTDGSGYKIQASVELAPGEMKTFSVQIDDIWSIPEEYYTELQQHGAQLVSKLGGTSRSEQARSLQQILNDQIESSRRKQLANSLDAVPALQHMQAYEVNRELIAQARKSLGELEGSLHLRGTESRQNPRFDATTAS